MRVCAGSSRVLREQVLVNKHFVLGSIREEPTGFSSPFIRMRSREKHA